jgi:signal transduction histidine kinase
VTAKRQSKIEYMRRLELIKDSILGVGYHLPNPEVVIFPFLDNLLLLHQRALVFAFWDGGECVYRSINDPDYLSRNTITWDVPNDSLIYIPGIDYQMSIHSFSSPRAENNCGNVVLPVDHQATDDTRNLIAMFKGEKVLDEFLTSIGQSIKRRIGHATSFDITSQRENVQSYLTLDYNDVRAYLKPIRQVLDDIFFDTIRAGHFTISKGPLEYPNIFAAVKSSPTPEPRYNGAFHYTLGLLLLSNTETALRRWFGTSEFLNQILNGAESSHEYFNDPDNCIRALEQPLGIHSRAVADLVFSSGIADIGRRAGESGFDVSGESDKFDHRRRTIESLVYPHNWLFYVPIHVGGAPWITLFTFTEENPARDVGAWHHNYSFYRDLVQKVGSVLRVRAHEVYSELVASEVADTIGRFKLAPKKTLVAKIREVTQKLAQVYPYPMLTIDDPGAERQLDVPGKGILGVGFFDNPFFPRQVSWDLGNEDEIFNRLGKEVRHLASTQRAIEIGAVARTSHFIKVPLRVLSSILSVQNPERDQLASKQIAKILYLHDAAAAALSSDKAAEFRNKYRKTAPLEEFLRLVQEHWNNALKFFSEDVTSGNLASKLREMLERNEVEFDVVYSDSQRLQVVAFYEPQIIGLLDGLLDNAIRETSGIDRRISVRISSIDSSPEVATGFVSLRIENTNSEKAESLSDLVQNLNSPGPDMVGVSEMHWISAACWRSDEIGTILEWSIIDTGIDARIVARAIIAEVIS